MNIKEILEDNSGGLSSMRVAFLCVLAVIIGLWGWVSWKTSTLKALPDTVVALVLGLAGTKAVQRFGEK